jgi:hypothetical protein
MTGGSADGSPHERQRHAGHTLPHVAVAHAGYDYFSYEAKAAMKDLNDPSFKIAEIDGPNGTFGIAFGGTTKEALYYLYRDSKYRFFFYADVNPKPIWRVTVESTSGISVSREEEVLLKENIAFFFRTRDNIRPAQQARAGAAAEIVEFKWRIAR